MRRVTDVRSRFDRITPINLTTAQFITEWLHFALVSGLPAPPSACLPEEITTDGVCDAFLRIGTDIKTTTGTEFVTLGWGIFVILKNPPYLFACKVSVRVLVIWTYYTSIIFISVNRSCTLWGPFAIFGFYLVHHPYLVHRPSFATQFSSHPSP